MVSSCVLFKQKTAYEMRISDWSSDVCSSDLSDIISIHCPHNPETHELMDARRIGLLEPSAYVINTSRGVIVDEGALVEALEAQRIAGAGLDVYRHEPEIEDRKSVVEGKGVPVRVNVGGSRNIKKKKREIES